MTAILRGESTERPGGVSLSGATYRRRFLVRTTSIYDGPHAVVRCDGAPQMLTPYFDGSGVMDPNALVIDLQAVPRESPTEWFLDVEYGPVDQDFVNGNGNPLNANIQISGGLSQFTKLTNRDYGGNPITNSAGDPYAAQEIDDSRPEIEITRNEAGFSVLNLAFYKDAVNSDYFLGFPPGTLKMKYIGFRQQQQGGIVYAEVTYHMEYAHAWWLELLDEGYRELVAGTKKDIFLPDSNGAKLIRPNAPVFLDGEGHVLPAGDQPKFRAWHMYPPRPFNAIIQGGQLSTGFTPFGSAFGFNPPGTRQFPGAPF